MGRDFIRDPKETLRALVAADVRFIYARDPGLAAGLDVSPPAVEPLDDLMRVASPGASGERRGLAYRAARKIYRTLKHWNALQPILEGVRNEVRRRS